LNETLEFVCDEASAGTRLDVFLSEQADVTRSAAQKLIESGDVTVSGKTASKNYKLKKGDEIVFMLPEPVDLEAVPENIPLDIVFEDSELIIVNKPQGMVVHPAAGHGTGTLVNALLYHAQGRLSAINGVIRPGIVHRIDKDTSGILAIAKTNEAHLSLSEQISEKTVKREYICVCDGIIKTKKGIIDAPIGRDPSNRLKMAVTPTNSKKAITHFEVLEYFEKATLVKCVLETGRTHQIRVHMKYIGHPVMGDPLYASSDPLKLGGQALHARVIGFVHPKSGEYMEFSKEPPEKFLSLLDDLRMKTE